jgi:hypothetical protein
VLDPDCPTVEIIRLYHEHWEIETAFAELKSTTLGGRVLRAPHPRRRRPGNRARRPSYTDHPSASLT